MIAITHRLTPTVLLAGPATPTAFATRAAFAADLQRRATLATSDLIPFLSRTTQRRHDILILPLQRRSLTSINNVEARIRSTTSKSIFVTSLRRCAALLKNETTSQVAKVGEALQRAEQQSARVSESESEVAR